MGRVAELLRRETAPTQPIEPDGMARTTTLEGLHAATDYVGILKACGHDPSRVTFAAPPSVYQKFGEDGEPKFTTYRYKLQNVQQPLDLEPLIERVKTAPARVANNSTGPHWFAFQAGDQQLGKRSRDGSTEQIVERYLQAVENAVAEFHALKRHGIEGIQVSMPGDCLEGIVSQGGRNVWLTQETITEQFRILRRLILHTVEAFAPLVDQVCVDVVNGNHDESQRQVNTYPGDGWATEAAIAVQDALQINPGAYGHVTIRTPDKWSGNLVVPVGSTLVGVVHGHQFPIGKGMGWWKEQTFGRQPLAGAEVLQHGHGHRWELETEAGRIRVSSPTFDCGSDHWREKHGAESLRGGLVYLLKNGMLSRMSLV